ncbi:MAG: TonB-dependent receptor [Acidobacteria bacterium]|nr:TonB-dependent receptor [Acidobacteriota bacterium]
MRTTLTVAESLSQESPSSVTVWGRPQIASLPGVNLDDRLRLLPGFSLFRRSSSLVANPTTQGVSLRGLGSTGASRSLVLWDGIPLNSPFGGWIYWTRVAPEFIERTETVRSASTSLFGDKAMGGSIGLFSPQPVKASAWLGYDGGSAATHQLDGGGSYQWKPGLALSGAARAFRTDGYYIVPPESRGPVDTPANVRFAAGQARGDLFDARQRLFLRADVLAEDRDNGTTLTRNSTSLGTAAAGYARELPGSSLNLLAFHTREEYRASFSSIGAGRQTERLTSLQSVPSEATGAAGYWRKPWARWNVTAGGDFVRAEGYSLETLLPAGSRTGGGVQSQYGLFTQADAAFGPLRLFGGFRGHSPGNGRAFWMPSGGASYGRENWRWRASAYRAFRAPTLNELYREFRAGNSITLANQNLRPEALSGVETGGDYTRSGFRASLTGYYNSLEQLITNVTRSVTPVLITRQRDNAAAATVRGIEASAAKRWSRWSIEGSWLLADSRFSTGERIPQVPRNQGSALATWNRKGTLITAGLRASSLQFEDDRNLFLLPGYAVLQFTLRQALPKGLTAQFTIENALDRQVLTGYSPVPQTGAPRLLRAGIRWNLH